MQKRNFALSLCIATAGIASMTTIPSSASAQPAAILNVDLPPQPLATTLKDLAVRYGQTVLASDEVVAGRISSAIKGRYDLEQALRIAIQGTDLSIQSASEGYLIVARQGAGKAADDGEQEAILVTGSRLRGTELATPITVLDSQALLDTGFADLGEVARSLPQSFGGGQNPGIGLNVPGAAGANVGGGSTVNLRGLGSDATLTILNGRRLPYDSAMQGVDISAIPVAAVERMEIVADGASAVYGSDAVGGVVNIILRQDYEGLATRGRVGFAAGGGGQQQLYSVLAGHRWRGGGMFVTYEYGRNSVLTSNERASTRSHPNLTLLPGSRRHAVAAHFHQDLSDRLTIEADALYNTRQSWLSYPINPASDLDVSRVDQSFRSYSLALAGALHYQMGQWELSAAGTYGTGRNDLSAEYAYNNQVLITSDARYANTTKSGEISATGPLFGLPGGDAKAATGFGFRNNGFEIYYATASYLNATPSQSSRYAFAELSLPLISPELAIPLARKLIVSAALRHEDYDGVGHVTTPKLGIIFSPGSALDLKGTWGRSFRAPSFYDRYLAQSSSLYGAARLGGATSSPNATALLLTGGNLDLKPERAKSWSATASFHPEALGGALFEVTYFSTRYFNRVVTPIVLTAQSLSDPLYAAQVITDPSAEALAAAIAVSDRFNNFAAAPYDPANVVAIIDNRNVNAGRQTISGVDGRVAYKRSIGGGTATFDLNATYLSSKQQLAPGLPVETLAGKLFNPPHWRGRASAAWDGGALRLVGAVSYLGGIIDSRAAPVRKVRGMTTVDLGFRYRFDRGAGALDGLEIAVNANNIFNVLPAPIAATLYSDTPYDSTNYSALGRVVSFDVTRKW
ncbi:TonB-dependent receptor domain-containing protein [Novosphingobium gossypii]|uniref:TonB-dependent receptor domain-containing protein n=1 Tax=Novosphingobium gossypii TaxID=1604774 RepID=UPI003D1AD740